MTAMTSGQLIRWSAKHDRRARSRAAAVMPIAVGAALAAWVGWRASGAAAGTTAAVGGSHAWLAGALVAYGVAFLRVPFHIYWRSDAALLAQLPIDGRALFDAALVRCVRAAISTTIVVLIGLAPLAVAGDVELVGRHAVLAGVLGLAAALLLPAVSLGAAALVVEGAEGLVRAMTAAGGAPARPRASANAAAAPASASPAAVLGLVPGIAAVVVISGVLAVSPWLVGAAPAVPAALVLGAIAAVSLVAALAARAGASVMSRVLRDVSALDRQRLATLEIRPPTAIESLIARQLGAAGLVYRKTAQLMRRRFPMAYALGGLAFLVLVIVGLAKPADPTPWLTVPIAGAAVYGLALSRRLSRPPIELARLSATLPLPQAAQRTARLAWLLGWWVIFAGAPAVFAALRQGEPGIGLALTIAATVAMIVAGALPR